MHWKMSDRKRYILTAHILQMAFSSYICAGPHYHRWKKKFHCILWRLEEDKLGVTFSTWITRSHHLTENCFSRCHGRAGVVLESGKDTPSSCRQMAAICIWHGRAPLFWATLNKLFIFIEKGLNCFALNCDQLFASVVISKHFFILVSI